MKKIITMLMVLCMTMSLTACDSQDVKKAKECIDDIYEATSDIAEAEAKISELSYKSELSMEEKAKLLRYEVDKDVAEKEMERDIKMLEIYYKNMSDREREKIREYTEEALENYLIDIF